MLILVANNTTKRHIMLVYKDKSVNASAARYRRALEESKARRIENQETRNRTTIK
jgi:hypothetical protein